MLQGRIRSGGREHGDVGVRPQGLGESQSRGRCYGGRCSTFYRATSGPGPAGGRRAKAAVQDRRWGRGHERLPKVRDGKGGL